MGLRPLRSCFGVYKDLIISTIVDSFISNQELYGL